jgi:hypothetical protein
MPLNLGPHNAPRPHQPPWVRQRWRLRRLLLLGLPQRLLRVHKLTPRALLLLLLLLQLRVVQLTELLQSCQVVELLLLLLLVCGMLCVLQLLWMRQATYGLCWQQQQAEAMEGTPMLRHQCQTECDVTIPAAQQEQEAVHDQQGSTNQS